MGWYFRALVELRPEPYSPDGAEALVVLGVDRLRLAAIRRAMGRLDRSFSMNRPNMGAVGKLPASPLPLRLVLHHA
jgi:hypothetical protein